MYYGDFPEDATVYIPFNTFTSDDPAASSTITDLADSDIKVHKDGGTTQIATDGASVEINYDSVTGNHLITIDTSAHADYATGSEYQVRIEGTTVDGATINAWIGAFSIERAGGVLALLKAVPDVNIASTDDIDLSATQKASVNTEVDTAIETYHLDHLLAADYDPASKPGTSTALLNELVESDSGVSRFTANALEAITDDDTQIDASALNTASAAIGSNGSGLTEAGGDGDHLTEAGGDGDHLTEAGGTGDQFTALPTAAAIADAVWDEDATAHQTGGTFGQAIGDPGANTETMYDAVVTDAAGTNVAADIIAVKSETAAIVADTNELQTDDIPGTLSTIDGKIDTAQTDLDTLTGSDGVTLATAQGNYAPAKASDVNAQVLDVLNTDTFGEPTGVPGATVTLATKIGYLYMALRNRLTTTSSKMQFYDDSDNVEWEKDLSDDGTTYDESEGNAP